MPQRHNAQAETGAVLVGAVSQRQQQVRLGMLVRLLVITVLPGWLVVKKPAAYTKGGSVTQQVICSRQNGRF